MRSYLRIGLNEIYMLLDESAREESELTDSTARASREYARAGTEQVPTKPEKGTKL